MAGAVRRKVLRHASFGLCVCWPKTHWEQGPAVGRSGPVSVDGVVHMAAMHSEPCDCRGAGWHEHRFLVFQPASGLRPGDEVVISAEAPSTAHSISVAIAEVTDAQLLGAKLPASRRREIAAFLAGRQGLPGCYTGLFGPVPGELDAGFTTPTGEAIRSGGGALHVLGQEALRALTVCAGGGGSRGAAGEALARARAEMGARLSGAEAREASGRKGLYCCHRCSVALWRALQVGAYDEAEARLKSGLACLGERRDGRGRWRGFPFHYALLVLTEEPSAAALAELRYSEGAMSASLARLRDSASDPVAIRRRVILQRGLDLVS